MTEKANDRRNIELGLAMILCNLDRETNPTKRMGFEMVYRQSLKDHKKTDEQIRTYLKQHHDEVLEAIKNKGF